MRRLFIVDTENTNNYSFVSEYKLTKDDNIALFISNKTKGIKFDGIVELFETKAKVELEKVEVGEKNSLDFQLVVFVTERVFRGKFDEIYIVSNDNGYQAAISYLASKFKKNVVLLSNIKLAEGTESAEETALAKDLKEKEISTSEEVEKAIRMSINLPDETVQKIIEIKNQSCAINDFHNKMRNAFGLEEGRDLYLKLKPNIKQLF